MVPTPCEEWPACYDARDIASVAQDIHVAFPASYGLSVKVFSKVLRQRDGTAVVLYQDIYDIQPVYMLYHPLQNPFLKKDAIAAGLSGQRVRLGRQSVATPQTTALLGQRARW